MRNSLWRDLPFDEWGITYLRKNYLMSIVSHSPGFELFSMKYVDVEFSSTTCTILESSLENASKLVYLDLSGVPINSIYFLAVKHVPPLQTLILDDCNAINVDQNFITVLMQLIKLTTLSLNRVNLTPIQVLAVAKFLPGLFMLCVCGVGLTIQNVRAILESCPIRLQFLQMSCNSLENKQALLALCGKHDVSIIFS